MYKLQGFYLLMHKEGPDQLLSTSFALPSCKISSDLPAGRAGSQKENRKSTSESTSSVLFYANGHTWHPWKKEVTSKVETDSGSQTHDDSSHKCGKNWTRGHTDTLV